MAQLHCILVTPETTVRDVPAAFVALPLFDGEIGIAPGHTPMIGRLGAGEMRIRQAQGTSRFYVEGGFVQVQGSEVAVLTNRALPAESLDQVAAHEQLMAARVRIARSPEEMAIRDRAVTQARALLRVARRAEAQ